MFSPGGFWSMAGMLIIDLVVYAKLVVPGYWEIRRLWRLIRHGQPVRGVVMDHLQMKDADQYDLHAPVVRFTAKDGEEYTHESNEYRLFKKDIGTPVKIVYNIDNPFDAIINPIPALVLQWFLLTLAILVPVAITAVAVYNAIVER